MPIRNTSGNVTDLNQKTVETLGKEFEPIANTNNAFTAMQKLFIALRFFATGTHQIEIGDGEGASQASVSHIVKQVAKVLSDHMDDVVALNLDPDVLDTIAKGFFGFNGSKLRYLQALNVQKEITVICFCSNYTEPILLISEFPNCVGAIDCTHMPVRPPKENLDQLKNRDGYFSLNVKMVVNH